MDAEGLQIQRRWPRRRAEGSGESGQGREEGLGRGITAGADGVGRGRHGVDACTSIEGVRRDSFALRASVVICLWSCSGIFDPLYSTCVVNAHKKLQSSPKVVKKARASLDASYSYLGGNAFGRDKKGRVTKDDSSTSAEMQAAGHMGDGGDYSAYVCYEFEIQ